LATPVAPESAIPTPAYIRAGSIVNAISRRLD
jgi:hypothetical protein